MKKVKIEPFTLDISHDRHLHELLDSDVFQPHEQWTGLYPKVEDFRTAENRLRLEARLKQDPFFLFRGVYKPIIETRNFTFEITLIEDIFRLTTDVEVIKAIVDVIVALSVSPENTKGAWPYVLAEKTSTTLWGTYAQLFTLWESSRRFSIVRYMEDRHGKTLCVRRNPLLQAIPLRAYGNKVAFRAADVHNSLPMLYHEADRMLCGLKLGDVRYGNERLMGYFTSALRSITANRLPRQVSISQTREATVNRLAWYVPDSDREIFIRVARWCEYLKAKKNERRGKR